MRRSLMFLVFLSVHVAGYGPVSARAEPSEQVTRAQVKSELAQLRQAGYSNGGDQSNYPENLLAALQKINERDHLPTRSSDGAAMNSNH